MNTERLSELTEFLLTSDQRLKLQEQLERLQTYLQSLTNAPQDANVQGQVNSEIDQLEQAMATFDGQLTPARVESIREIGGLPLFSSALPAGIRAHLNANGVTPAVVRDRVSQLVGERRTYLNSLAEAHRSLASLGVGGGAIPPGTTELGLLLPRSLFRNSLDGLTSELEQLNDIIDVFSEIATGSVDIIEIREISTTDPIFFFGITLATLKLMGSSINWCLESWKKIEEIREIHERTRMAGLGDDVLAPLKKAMNDVLDQRLTEYSRSVIEDFPRENAERANELGNSLRKALKDLLAKIERGMTVEIRMLPPANGGGEAGKEEAAQFAELALIAKQLEFPKIGGVPLIPLNAPPAGEAGEGQMSEGSEQVSGNE